MSKTALLRGAEPRVEARNKLVMRSAVMCVRPFSTPSQLNDWNYDCQLVRDDYTCDQSSSSLLRCQAFICRLNFSRDSWFCFVFFIEARGIHCGRKEYVSIDAIKH